MKTPAYAALSADRPLEPFTVERRALRPNDVGIDILYCGICYSDIGQAKNMLGYSRYPMVPGHEIVGRVANVGSAVTSVKVGDLVGVGGGLASCRTCAMCTSGHDQFCATASRTYNSTDVDGTPTYGGYSKHIVATEPFVLEIPASLDPAGTAPLLCAGITTYSALKQCNVKKGDRVAVVGLGGLGHVGVKIAAAMGAEVTIFSTSRSKEADAKRLGATHFALSTDPDTFENLAGTFDVVLDTLSADHDVNAYLSTLKPFGTLALVGVGAKPLSVMGLSLLMGNKRLLGSVVGGTPEMREMLAFCGEHGIVADVEVIPASKINEAFERTVKSDVRYRFVIDLATM